MNTNIDFKQIWNKQEATVPEIKELLKKATIYKRKSLIKLLLLNTTMILTSVFIGLIWYYFQPELVSTKLGIVLVILAMMIQLATSNRMLPNLFKSNAETTSKQYLQQLIELQKKQLFQQTTVMSIYFILLSIGLALYMYEYTLRMTLTWALVAYGITTLWIAINWFYFRPKAIKKQNKKMNILLDKFKEMTTQLSED